MRTSTVGLACTFFGVALVVTGGCARPSTAVDARASTDERAIINGASCTEAEFPTAMAVLVDATIDFSDLGGGVTDLTTVMCTGTLIAPDTVLTAAHCTDATGLTLGFGEVQRAEFYVTFESDLTALAEQTGEGEPPAIPASAIPVRAAVPHEEFRLEAFNEGVNGPGDFKDIALLFLAANIEDVKPELLMTAEQASALVAGAEVDIAGWGQQEQTESIFTPPPPGTVGLKVCGAATINEVGDFEMQIGGDATTTRKCHGDSGGPTYLEIDGVRRVVGITSHAYDQEDCNKGGVDTRVDVWLPWIDAQMVAGCDAGERLSCDVPGIPTGEPPPAESEDEGEGEEEGDEGCAAVPAAPLSSLALALFVKRGTRRRSQAASR